MTSSSQLGRAAFGSAIAAALLGACVHAGAPHPTASPRPAAPTTASSGSAAVPSATVQTPPAVALRDVQLPPCTERSLNSGLAVWHVAEATVPVTHLRLIVDAGSADDGAKPGTALVTATALALGASSTKGQRTGAPAVADRMRIEVTPHATVFSLDVLNRETRDGIELLGGMVSRAAFRQIDTEAARSRLSRPTVRTRRQMLQARLNEPASPASPALGGLDVQAYYRTHYGATHLRLVIVGAVPLDVAVDAAESAFGGWTGAPAGEPRNNAPEFAWPIVLSDTPDATSTLVEARVPSPPLDEGAWPAFWLAVAIVQRAGGARCDLSLVAGRPPGVSFCGDGASADIPETLRAWWEASQRLAGQAPSDEALVEARRAVLDWLAIRASSAEGVASLLTVVAESGATPAVLADVGAKLRAVRAADVSTAARVFMAKERWRVAVSGPSAALREPLSRLGDVRDAVASPPSLPVSPSRR